MKGPNIIQNLIFEAIGVTKSNHSVPEKAAVLFFPYTPLNQADIKLPQDQFIRWFEDEKTNGKGYKVQFVNLKLLNTIQGIKHYQADSWEFIQE